MTENRLNNQKELDLAKEALEISLASGAQQARVTLNMGMQNAFAVLDGKLDRLHMTNDRSLYIQLYSNGRYGVFSTNRMDKGELKHFIKEAVTASSLLAEDKCRTLPDKELYFKGEEEDLLQFDPLVLTMNPDEKKRMAFEAYREMEGKSDLVVSANAEYGDYIDYQYFVDSQGFEGEILQSGFSISAECSVKGKSNARPEAWWYDSAMLFQEFNPHGCGGIALNRALAKLSPKKIKSGKYKMIVENSCSSRLVSPIFSALNGSNIQQNNSFLLNKLGERVFPEHMNIIDTPHLKGMSGSRYFDSEGIATQERKIIDNGVVNTYFINTYYANKLGVKATIESASVPTISSMGYQPEYQDMSLEQMMKVIGNGILVTGFNGGNCNETTGDFSYGVEGFLIKNGEIAHPIREMNITGNMINLWNNLLFSANDARKCTRWQIPSLAFDAVDFTGL